MSPIVTLLLAGTIVSTALKVGILLVGAKAYRDHRQPAGSPAPAHNWLTSLSARFDRRAARGQPATSATEVERLLAWAQATSAPDDELRTWLRALSASEAQGLTRDVAAFCATWQLELSWLFEAPFAHFPELQAQLGKIVLAYCRARWAASSSKQLSKQPYNKGMSHDT